ncbi:MAG: DinB family protein [bacterium]
MSALLLHDPATRESLRTRLKRLTPTASRQWGQMSVDQMLWHLNQSLTQALGRMRYEEIKPPLPRPIMKFVVLNFRWPKSAPTAPEFDADGRKPNLEAERARCLDLIDTFAAKSLSDPWPDSIFLGKMSGRDASRLQAKHIDYHLTQFGV